MPEIGATLREARMRARIDISDIEVSTKIRAKYLRALENEEWNLLPGPTYVKSFLRTYAEALGLDAKLLVEEYKLRHERLSEVDMQPISAASPGRQRMRSGPIIPRGAVIGLVFLALIIALYALGQSSGDNGKTPTPKTGAITPHPHAPPASAGGAHHPAKPAAPRRVSLQVVATGPVYLCLAAGDHLLIPGETLQVGVKTQVYRSKHFKMVLGNASVQLLINGHVRTVTPSSQPIGLDITAAQGRRPLPAARRPACQ